MQTMQPIAYPHLPASQQRSLAYWNSEAFARHQQQTHREGLAGHQTSVLSSAQGESAQ